MVGSFFSSWNCDLVLKCPWMNSKQQAGRISTNGFIGYHKYQVLLRISLACYGQMQFPGVMTIWYRSILLINFVHTSSQQLLVEFQQNFS